jgi:tetratricopeptide (TPR) repeat protein
MKSLILAMLLILVILFAKFLAVEDAINRNLAALGMVQNWKAKPRNLYQVNCAQNGEKSISSFPISGPRPTVNGHQSFLIAARDAFYSDDCDDALSYWKLVLEDDPLDSSAAIMQYLSSGLDEEYFPADTSLEDISEFLNGLGLQAEQNQMPKQAEYWFARSFELYPSRQAADRLLAFQPDPEDQAHIWWSLTNTLAKEDPDYWWALGQYSELEHEWDLALQAYSEGESIAPKPFDFIMQQGKVYAHIESWDRAVLTYRLASDLRSDDVNPYLEIGHIYRLQREYEKAKIWYEEALAKSPDHFTATFYFALINYQLGKFSPARHYFQHAVDLKPGHAASTYYLAQTLNRIGDSKKALEYLEKAVNLQSEKSWRWLVDLGDWREKEGDIQGALAAYKEALTLQQVDTTLINNKIQKIEDQQ